MSVYFPACRVAFSVVFDGFGGPDSSPTTFVVKPRSCRVVKNSYKEADTFDVSFDGIQLPISPEMIRGAGVEIYMYRGNNLELAASPQKKPPIMFSGLIDKAKLQASDDGLEFSCSGRDYTGLLLDRQWDPTRRVPIGDKLTNLVQKLADEVTQGVGAGHRLIVRFDGEPNEVPLTVGVVHNKKSKKRGFTQQGGSNYWEVIYNLCIRHGYIVFVEDREIIITYPNVLTEKARADVVRVVYGKNLDSLQVERNLGKETVPQIICRSYDPATKRLLEARYPEKPETPAKGIGTKRNEQRSFVLWGCTDEKILKRAARNAYHALARGEGKIRFSTSHLMDGANHELLEMKAGRAVAIGFEPWIPDATFSRLSYAERVDKLQALGYNSNVAQLISQEWDKIDYFRRAFYLTEVTFDFDEGDGIVIEAEAQNYISEDRALKQAGEALIAGATSLTKKILGSLGSFSGR
jgi:hypothetical protein